MTTLREAAQQALEALESIGQPVFALAPLQDAITALRAALAEPEPPQCKPLTDDEIDRITDA